MTTHPATSTPTVDLDWPSDRPELLPFLPLVYVAWSDGTLEAEELSTICDRIESQSWLEPEARTAVQRWLQPDSPPSAAALQRLREAGFRKVWNLEGGILAWAEEVDPTKPTY